MFNQASASTVSRVAQRGTAERCGGVHKDLSGSYDAILNGTGTRKLLNNSFVTADYVCGCNPNNLQYKIQRSSNLPNNPQI